MTIEEKFAELERLMQDRAFEHMSLPILPSEELRKSQMMFIVSDNSSTPKVDFSRYAKLASNSR